MSMEYVRKRIEELKPYANNPRINDDAAEDVAESIRQCSYVAPIIVDENGEILAGHTRFKALKILGYEECDVIVVTGLTDEQKRKYRLYDNKAGELATWDKDKLGEELSDVDFQGYDFGQPVFAVHAEAEEGAGKTRTCPCCGEVFEVEA